MKYTQRRADHYQSCHVSVTFDGLIHKPFFETIMCIGNWANKFVTISEPGSRSALATVKNDYYFS